MDATPLIMKIRKKYLQQKYSVIHYGMLIPLGGLQVRLHTQRPLQPHPGASLQLRRHVDNLEERQPAEEELAHGADQPVKESRHHSQSPGQQAPKYNLSHPRSHRHPDQRVLPRHKVRLQLPVSGVRGRPGLRPVPFQRLPSTPRLRA